MSPLEIYLIMQAAELKEVLLGSVVVGSLVGGFVMFFSYLASHGAYPSPSEDAAWCDLKKKVPKCVGMLVTLLAIGTMIPSTKTLAAMYVVPKMTKLAASDAVTAETRELYSLAKQALQNAAGLKETTEDKDTTNE